MGSGTEVVSVLAQRAASEGPRWMRAIETTSMPDLSGEKCKEKCARTMRAVEYPAPSALQEKGEKGRREKERLRQASKRTQPIIMCAIEKASTFSLKGEK